MKASTNFSGGFSLVEIVFSIGIMSFAMVAIMGLLSAGLLCNRDSLDESLISAMSRQVTGSLRQQPFGNTTATSNLLSGVPVVCYFDANGIRLLQTNGKDVDEPAARSMGAVYQCTVSPAKDYHRQGPIPPGASPCLLDLSVMFEWPVGARSPSKLSLRTAMAKYY